MSYCVEYSSAPYPESRKDRGFHPRFLVEELGSLCAFEYALYECEKPAVLGEEAKLGRPFHSLHHSLILRVISSSGRQ
ncbi:hypothetical protein NOR_08762 [Metarhizium rileyi]|uniref:Uncharacterized protein n=1 Tax=Metarhizium rileyi (strain RCEF 4871) TaxID=1649241 RepID=A0A166VMV1_METRR|nr:hypothetical protein NOR_08762 [Metarhizium rileyi RCEF 4871]